MSDHVARSVAMRVHMREVAVASHYSMGFASDLRTLASMNAAAAEEAFLARRSELVAAYGLPAEQQRKPFAFSNGVAVIPVHGTLINRFGYSWGSVTGYNFIRQQTAMAGADPEVKAIVYDVNSYGGEAAGCFECSNDIKGLAGGKPTYAFVDSNAYSGGYAIAAGTDKIILTPSGGVGSIGVVVAHFSFEKMLADAGVTVTFVFAGKHKVDGNPYEDLTDEVKADIQKNIDVAYSAFVAHVAKGRNMDEKAVRATEAKIFRAEEAKSLGLIDAVATPSAAMQALMGELSGSNPQPRSNKEDAMSDAAKTGAESKGTPEELANARTEAAKAERARVSGIQSCEEAKGRESLASHLAFNTDMGIDAAKAVLAASPKADVSTGKSGFEQAMNTGKHPEVGVDGGKGEKEGGETEHAKNVSFLLASARAAGVPGFTKQSA